MIELDGVPSPPVPPSFRHTATFAFRAPRPLIRWMREQAAIDGVTPSAWVSNLVRRERDFPTLPGDCREWLQCQAAAAGYPHDEARALVDVIRQLADRYPHGVRLPPERS